jgi:glycosyltransferase involved in cell wall biosynthesis
MQALRSLQTQDLSDFEIIVVDNGGDSELERTVQVFNHTATIPVCYISEPELGLHNARHAGARMATSDLLIFTDDDATFDPQWLREYANAFEKYPEMVAAGGPVRPIWEKPPPDWLVLYLKETNKSGILSLIELYPEFRMNPTGFFFGVNMAIRRHVLFEVGGFNPESFGDLWLGDGESGLNRKLWERKMLIGYIPEAVVYHHIPPERMTLYYLCQRMKNQGASDLYAEYHCNIPPTHQLLKRAFLLLLQKKFWIKPFLFYRGRTDRHSVDVQLHTAWTIGQFRYLYRLIRSQSLRSLVLKNDWLTPCLHEPMNSGDS